MVAKPASTTDATATIARIDAYLAALPVEQRTVLGDLRATIAVVAPDAVEAISYGLPAYRYHGRPLVAYSGAKAHCSLFPMSGAVLGTFHAELAGFDSAKGTLRFTPDHPIPDELVASIVRARMAEIDGASKSG
jgi:uncharacterized protein YdhG (YjbR/CyaY superfamily)